MELVQQLRAEVKAALDYCKAAGWPAELVQLDAVLHGRAADAIERLQAERDALKQKLDARAESEAAWRRDMAQASDDAVRALGYEPRQLQLRWRSDPPRMPSATDHDARRAWHHECLTAIVDALVHEGVIAWWGDATECVEMIVTAFASRLTWMTAERDALAERVARLTRMEWRGRTLMVGGRSFGAYWWRGPNAGWGCDGIAAKFANKDEARAALEAAAAEAVR